eukprot:2693069-Prymnesium_polylepis.1
MPTLSFACAWARARVRRGGDVRAFNSRYAAHLVLAAGFPTGLLLLLASAEEAMVHLLSGAGHRQAVGGKGGAQDLSRHGIGNGGHFRFLFQTMDPTTSACFETAFNSTAKTATVHIHLLGTNQSGTFDVLAMCWDA